MKSLSNIHSLLPSLRGRGRRRGLRGLGRGLWAAFLLPFISIVFSCSEEEDCSMTDNRPMMNCRLYTIDPETLSERKDTLDSLTVTAFGTDSIIINRMSQVKDISLPLRYAVDSTQLIFSYSGGKRDTVTILHNNTPYFVSMDCGFQMKQVITGVRHTRILLDSIDIKNNETGIYGEENLKLFY